MTPSDCLTCSGPSRETVGLVCQTCGTDYGTPDYTPTTDQIIALRRCHLSGRSTGLTLAQVRDVLAAVGPLIWNDAYEDARKSADVAITMAYDQGQRDALTEAANDYLAGNSEQRDVVDWLRARAAGVGK